LFGTFKVEKNIRLIGYILTDIKGIIETITSCIFYLFASFFVFISICFTACYTILRSDLKLLSGKSIESYVFIV